MILALATGPLAPALQAVGWALLHLVWQGTAIAVALALLLALLPSRSANLRYALSCGAMLLLVVVAVLTGWRSYRPDVPAPRPASHAVLRHAEPVRVAAPAPAPSAAAIVVATFAPARVATLPDPWRAASDALPAVVTLWLAGVTVLSLRLIVQWLRARRLATENAQPACEPWLAMAHRLSRALGVRHVVRLLESTAVHVPAVVGLLRPVILLPANTLTGLLPGQLEMILAHELAHIRRHDFLANLLQAAVETLLFYHPAVWWISNQVRIERENCCDDLAVSVCGNPIQYARALARLEELRAEPLPLALSARGGSLLHRIRRVVNGPAASTGSVRGVTALALLVGLLLAFATPSLTAIAKPNGAASARPRLRAASPAKAENAATKTGKAAATVDIAAEREADPEAEPAVQASPEGGCTEATGTSNAGDAVVAGADGGDADVAPNSTEAIAHGRIRLTVDELIELRAQGVTTADILEMRSVFPSIDIREIAGMYAVGATPEYVRGIRAAGLDVRSYKEAKNMAAVGVTPEFIADMRDAGLHVRSAGAASSLAAVGVTSEYIRNMRAAGFAITSADDAKSLAAVGVTPEFVRAMRDAGFAIATANEAAGLAAVGVTPDYVRGMRATGLKLGSASELQGLAAVGVTPKYVSDMRETGLDVPSARELQSLAAVGVTPDYVREMRATGIPLRDASQAQSLAAIGVTPKFVRKLVKAGYANLSVSDLCRLAAGGMTDSFIEEMAQYRTH
jgi:beta-lactamase regulating signal transducer with metallopeptidase domain